MSTEVVLLEIKAGLEQEFLQAFRERAVVLLHAGNASDVVLYRSQERAAHFVMRARFPSREARVKEFMASPGYEEFAALVGKFLAAPPAIDDYDVVHADS